MLFIVVVWHGQDEVACVRNIPLERLQSVISGMEKRYPGHQFSVEQTPPGGEVPNRVPPPSPGPCLGGDWIAPGDLDRDRDQPDEELTSELTTPASDFAREVSLGERVLFDAYQRAAATQAYCVQQMTATAGEMNKRFLDQLDAMQARHQAAMERLDAVAFERKMMEHEATVRHLSSHFRRLAEDERRANAPGIGEQLAHHVVAILNEFVGRGTGDNDPAT